MYETKEGYILFNGVRMKVKDIVNHLNHGQAPTVFKRATPKNILSGSVKDYYVKADEITVKQAMSALKKGQLFVEVKK